MQQGCSQDGAAVSPGQVGWRLWETIFFKKDHKKRSKPWRLQTHPFLLMFRISFCGFLSNRDWGLLILQLSFSCDQAEECLTVAWFGAWVVLNKRLRMFPG